MVMLRIKSNRLGSAKERFKILVRKNLTPVFEYLSSRSDSEKRLMILAAIAILTFIIYKSSWIYTSIKEKFTNQLLILDQSKNEVALLSDPDKSPIKIYKELDSRVTEINNRFESKLKTQGNIATLENILKKHLKDEKFFNLEERAIQSFQGGISRTPYRISIRTGSLRTLANVLRELLEGEKTFSISSIKVEKNYQKYLQVDIDASSLSKSN